MRWLGLVLALIGIAGVILSRYTLGRSFSIVPKATALVTTGIYSKIRNPIYVSGTFFIAGAVLMLRRPEGLLLLMIVIPLQIFRARREAAVLEAKFGDEYREYRRRTWF
jgi:protein-S-isoprenylcysteine O-methyltransferase Ste14